MSESEITWTSCAEQMPPDNREKSILKINGRIYQAYNIDLWNERNLYGPKERILYTTYTPEKWMKLKKRFRRKTNARNERRRY